MLSLEDYKPIELEDKPLFDKHYKRYPPFHSDYVFTTLISWMNYANYHFVFYGNTILIYSKINNQIRLRPPIGKRKKNIFDQVLKLAKEQDVDYPLGMIDAETKEWMKEKYPKLFFKAHRGFFDYVYLTSDLAKLQGSGYSKIRNRVNKFKKNYNYRVEKINKDSIPEIKKFLKHWYIYKNCESDVLLKNEKKAIIYSMDHFFELKLDGIVIRVDDNISAIAVYEKMNKDTAVVHYEKGSPYHDGIYKVINQETAKILQKNFKFINRESDMGLPGLRRVKMSYRPHHMIKVYHVEKNNLNNVNQ